MYPKRRRPHMLSVASAISTFLLILPRPSHGWNQHPRSSKTGGVPTVPRIRGATEDPIVAVVRAPSHSTIQSSSKSRRSFLEQATVATATASAVVWGIPSGAAWAADDGSSVGSRITEVVTTSDLGVSVRRSVVQGAQVLDRLDGQWESLSDRLGLGQARSQREGRPRPKVIPDPGPLNTAIAQRLLDLSDQAFCDALRQQPSAGKGGGAAAPPPLSLADLQKRVRTVAETVAPSFQRAGQGPRKGEEAAGGVMTTGAALNFFAYARFRTYNDVVLERAADIPNLADFKRQFEWQLGRQVVDLLVPSGGVSFRAPPASDCWIRPKLQVMEELTHALIRTGLVAAIDVSPIDADDLDDFCQGDGIASLAWSVALDGDVTLGSQVLLQEQGLRLYPNYARFALQALLGSPSGQSSAAAMPQLSIMDYYMDTDYNSDPNKFEVKEVLLNIELER